MRFYSGLCLFKFWGMTPFTAMLAPLGGPLDALAHFDRQEAIDAGLDPSAVDKWADLHMVYFGATRATRKQAQALRIARSTGKSLDQLLFIEQQVKKSANEWKTRLALLSVEGNFRTLQRRAKDIVEVPDKPAPKSSVRFSKSRKGKRSFTATGDERTIAALEHALRQNLHSTRPEGPQMYEAFTRLLRSGGGVSSAVPRPLVVVPLTDHISILGGRGDETILGLSDGTTMTGAEYLAQLHGAELEVALFHPAEGAVNLYRTQRFANSKQRDLARATLTTCPVPGCRHAADHCEIHHITAWAHGGETNMANLAPVCRYHNRANDDDPWRKHRGRIRRRRGSPVWVSPRGKPVPNNTHRYGAMHLLFGESGA